MNTSKAVRLSLSRLFPYHLRRNLTSSSAEPVTKPHEEKTIVVSRMGLITTIGINRPHKKNSIDAATAEQLSDALDDFEKDETSVAGVLYGIGGNFCAGSDLHEIANYNEESNVNLPHFGSLTNRLNLCPKKPLVAGLNGYTLGLGLEIALMCDLRVADETAYMGFLNRRYGIPILCGGTVRLPAMIGYSRAIDMILTGRLVDAKNAFAWGLANRLVSCGTALGQAVAVAQSLVKFNQNALLADRKSAFQATFSKKDLEEALQFEKDNASHYLFQDGVKNAKRFFDEGLGRHGKFYNITQREFTIRELDERFL